MFISWCGRTSDIGILVATLREARDNGNSAKTTSLMGNFSLTLAMCKIV